MCAFLSCRGRGPKISTWGESSASFRTLFPRADEDLELRFSVHRNCPTYSARPALGWPARPPLLRRAAVPLMIRFGCHGGRVYSRPRPARRDGSVPQSNVYRTNRFGASGTSRRAVSRTHQGRTPHPRRAQAPPPALPAVASGAARLSRHFHGSRRLGGLATHPPARAFHTRGIPHWSTPLVNRL